MAHKYTAVLFANAAAAMAVAWASVAHAQLYAREAPPNSAFIHIFNATPVGGVNAQIGDKSQPPLLPYAASAYIFLRQAISSFRRGRTNNPSRWRPITTTPLHPPRTACSSRVSRAPDRTQGHDCIFQSRARYDTCVENR